MCVAFIFSSEYNLFFLLCHAHSVGKSLEGAYPSKFMLCASV